MNSKPLRRPLIAAFTAAALVLAPAAAAAAAPPNSAGRGAVVSVTPVASLSTAEIAALGLGTAHIRYAVTGYRLVYRTVDVHGAPTTASGLVVLPDGAAGRLPAIEYEHGTRAYRGGVASMTAGNGDREGAELFAAAGYVIVAPDYLGLGVGPGNHPYLDVASEVTAGVDMLRAAERFAATERVRLDHTVRVTGFSQGGQAAMALAEAVQDGAAGGWRLTALAPISGPYHLQTTELPALVRHPGDGPGQIDPVEGVFYIAYWTVAMNRLHHFYADPAEVFQAPYDKTVEGLFDGNHPDEEIGPALPGSPDALLTPQYRQRLLHPSGPLLAALRDNDQTCQWHPRVPVHLYAADGDRDVTIGNTHACQTDLAAHGTIAPIVDVGNVDHNGSAMASVPLILDWFTSHP